MASNHENWELSGNFAFLEKSGNFLIGQGKNLKWRKKKKKKKKHIASGK